VNWVFTITTRKPGERERESDQNETWTNGCEQTMSKIEIRLASPIFQWKGIDWNVLETHGMDYTFDFLQKTYISARSGMGAGFVRSSTRKLSL
jgi:hypothetical protein